VLDPDPATRIVPTHAGAPRLSEGPYTLQILSTEHWSLLAARSLGYTEAMSRASMFIAALSGAVVALALVAQATDFGSGFVAFALLLLPVVFFLGIVTIARLGQINWEDAVWTQGMNRIRNAYLELAPELGPYFVTSRYDDDPGVLQSMLATSGPMSRMQPFIAIPGVVAVLDSVVAAAAVGIAAQSLDLGIGVSLAVGGIVFLLTVVLIGMWAWRSITTLRGQLVVRFPTPPDDGRTDA